MQNSPVNKFDRTFSWIAAILLGIPGLYDAITGSLQGNTGEAVYGFGKATVGLFFLLYVLQPASLQTVRAKAMLAGLLYGGLALGLVGFALKRGIL